MSLFGDYIKEREDFEIVECEHGFASYKIMGDECYIRDLYVSPKARKTGLASALADKIVENAKGSGCTHLTGSVSPNVNGCTDSMKVLLAYGFRLLKTDNYGVYFIKGI